MQVRLLLLLDACCLPPTPVGCLADSAQRRRQPGDARGLEELQPPPPRSCCWLALLRHCVTQAQAMRQGLRGPPTCSTGPLLRCCSEVVCLAGGSTYCRRDAERKL